MSHGSQSAGGLVVDDLESSMTGEIIQIGNGILYRVQGKRASTLVMRASNSLTFKAGAKVCCHYWSSGKRIAVPAVDLVPIAIAVASDQAFWIDCCATVEAAKARAQALGLRVVER